MRDTFTVSIQQLRPVLGDVAANRAAAEAACRAADADLVVFPELFLSGAPLLDLARSPGFAGRCMAEAQALAAALADGPAVAIGTPWLEDGRLTNACAVLQGGDVAVVRHKVEVRGGPPFDEARVFAAGDMPGPVDIAGVRVGLPIGEDVLGADVVECLAETGAEILVVPAASPFAPAEAERRLNAAVARVVESELPLVWVNAVGGQDAVVFDGASFALGADRRLTHQLPAFAAATERLVFRRGGEGWALEAGVMATVPDGAAATWSAAVLGLRDAGAQSGLRGHCAGADGRHRSGGGSGAGGRRRGFGGGDGDHPGRSRHPFSLCRSAGAHLSPRRPRFASASGSRPVGRPRRGGAAALRVGIADAVLAAIAENSGALLVRPGSATATALGWGPVGAGLNPLGDFGRTEIKALARWRHVDRPPGAFGPHGVVFAEPLLAAPLWRSAAGPDDEALDAILSALAGVDAPAGEGYDAETARQVARQVTDGEAMRRRATPRLRLAPRPAGDRRYPITNRYRDV